MKTIYALQVSVPKYQFKKSVSTLKKKKHNQKNKKQKLYRSALKCNFWVLVTMQPLTESQEKHLEQQHKLHFGAETRKTLYMNGTLVSKGQYCKMLACLWRYQVSKISHKLATGCQRNKHLCFMRP